MKKRKLQFDFWTVVTIGIIAVFVVKEVKDFMYQKRYS